MCSIAMVDWRERDAVCWWEDANDDDDDDNDLRINIPIDGRNWSCSHSKCNLIFEFQLHNKNISAFFHISYKISSNPLTNQIDVLSFHTNEQTGERTYGPSYHPISASHTTKLNRLICSKCLTSHIHNFMVNLRGKFIDAKWFLCALSCGGPETQTGGIYSNGFYFRVERNMSWIQKTKSEWVNHRKDSVFVGTGIKSESERSSLAIVEGGWPDEAKKWNEVKERQREFLKRIKVIISTNSR